VVAKIAEKLGGALVPPGIDPTLWWRLTVSGTLAFLCVAFLWSIGLFASLGFPGFARADQQQQILNELHAQKIERLEEAIMKEQRDYCESPPDSRARDTYLARRNMKLNEYREVTGRSYEGMPDCNEL
jgi:hypothetical protein